MLTLLKIRSNEFDFIEGNIIYRRHDEKQKTNSDEGLKCKSKQPGSSLGTSVIVRTALIIMSKNGLQQTCHNPTAKF